MEGNGRPTSFCTPDTWHSCLLRAVKDLMRECIATNGKWTEHSNVRGFLVASGSFNRCQRERASKILLQMPSLAAVLKQT
jgi:hypothetical protein